MKAVALLAVLFLAGCNTTDPNVRTITHTVKVPVPCDPVRPTAPAWAVDSLAIGAPIDAQMRALRADRQRAKGYISELEAALSSCRQ